MWPIPIFNGSFGVVMRNHWLWAPRTNLNESSIQSVSHSLIDSFLHSFIHLIQLNSVQFKSVQSFIRFLQCINFNAPLASSPTIPISKLVPIAMSYVWNFRPSACRALSWTNNTKNIESTTNARRYKYLYCYIYIYIYIYVHIYIYIYI